MPLFVLSSRRHGVIIDTDHRNDSTKIVVAALGEIPLMPALGPAELIVLLLLTVLLVWPMWRICTKAGFPGPLGLMAVIPVLNLVLLFFLAFAEWPALREKKPHMDADF
jgi:hypothetical protein